MNNSSLDDFMAQLDHPDVAAECGKLFVTRYDV